MDLVGPVVHDPVLQLNDAAAAIGETELLRDVTLSVAAGDIVLAVGPNGAGKSTLLRVLAGELPLSRGRLETADLTVAVLGDSALLYDLLTVREHVEFFARIWNRPASVVDVLERAGIGHLAGSYGRDLSLGERQRLSLALILLGEPGVVLMDEPFNGLDARGVRALRRQISGLREAGTATVVVTHLVDLVADLATRVWLVESGRIREMTQRDTCDDLPAAVRAFIDQGALP